ncbi:MAG: hypothetical protein R2756_08580 [Bacteroidales bacterium]
MLLEAVQTRGLTALIARSADFYGPETENNFITQMVLKNITIGKKPMWFVSPDIKHSFTYTPDAGKAPLCLAILLMPTVRYGISRQKTGP